MMSTASIRDVLTSFSPSLDYLAISSGDGRIKVWDTLRGQIQTEFADIFSTDETNVFSKPGRGHLSVDYTCMKWMSLDKKRKRKLSSSLLVLGTGSGDVIALDVSAGQLKWNASDCHPGGVSSISSSTNATGIYTAGADGMICKLDLMTGNQLEKFKASSKQISSLAVSSDGKILASASGQLKVLNTTDYKKMQKFSGHPGAVRCMTFTEDGSYLLSSAAGEKYIAIWDVSGGKKKSANSVLTMDHPAVLLDTWCAKEDDIQSGIYVLAISETGVCYFWYGKTTKELHNTKPTKISTSLAESSVSLKSALPTIFAAKLSGCSEPASQNVFVSHGLLVKPSFQKILVTVGTDVKLISSQDGVLLPTSQSNKSTKGIVAQKGVTALDRANAEDALLPIPKVINLPDSDIIVPATTESKESMDEDDVETVTLCMEDQLRLLGILQTVDDPLSSMNPGFSDIDLNVVIPQKKIRATVLAMASSAALNFLKFLVGAWKSRSSTGEHILPWIYNILVNHGQYIISQNSATELLDSIHKISRSRGVAVESLLQLSGRFHIVTAQIDKAVHNKTKAVEQHTLTDESEDEDEDDDELLHEEENESQISSDDADDNDDDV